MVTLLADTRTVGAAIVIAIVALVVFAFARMAWRLARGDIEAEPGGSYGEQLSEHDERPRDVR